MKIPHGSFCDVFVKVGGSILDHAGHTATLAASLAELDVNLRPVILTGGGRLAKRIKANQRCQSSDFPSSWRAATLALDVNAGLFASHSTRFRACSCVAQIVAAHEAGKLPIFAPAEALFGSLWFEPNWTITTDTMGLYFAHLLGALRYVIVTDVDGVCERAPPPDVSVPPISRVGVGELERLPSSKLDAAFPAYFRHYPITTVVVNGKYPSRVRAALCGERTIGTEIATEVEVAVNNRGLERSGGVATLAISRG
jgi:5-(aminomethyl)-3-furanmethanol phosphate kinase